MKNLLPVYPVFQIEPVRGEGCYVYDKDDNRYLDFYGGHAVISIGHGHPVMKERLKSQIDALMFYSNSIINSKQQQVAEKILSLSGISEDFKFFMVNSGAEANENAVKLASMANGKNTFVVLENGFHGRTAAALSLTDKMKHRTAFDTDFKVVKIPINDIGALEQVMKDESVCAITTEAIQGIGGIYTCSPLYLKAIRKLCDENQSLWIADEVQCGFGRSGKFWAFQHADVEPDIITMAKGMGNGFPVGGLMIKESVLPIEYGMAGTTFGGNHLACEAVLSVLEVLESENLIQRASEKGEWIKQELIQMMGVKEVRGKGLMIGIEMDFPIAELRKKLILEEKIFTGSSSQKHTLRLLPPLNITDDAINHFLQTLQKSISAFIEVI